MRDHSSSFEHWSELSLAVILLVSVAIGWNRKAISAESAEVIGVVTASLAISVGLIKEHARKTIETLSSRHDYLGGRTSEISSILEKLHGSQLQRAVEIVDTSLEWLRLIPSGTIPFQPSAYYNELTNAMRSAKKGCHVFAVSSMPIERWEVDPRQKHYLDENVKATKRGVKIERVFIVESAKLAGVHLESVKKIVQAQQRADIQVFLVLRDAIRHDPALYDDFVLFKENGIVFTDEHERMDPTRVVSGYIISNPEKVQRYTHIFRSLTETYCLEQEALEKLLK